MSWDLRKRNLEICLMFRTVERLRLRGGRSEEEAKQDAYDAIELRFGLTKTRVRHIVCELIKENYADMVPLFIQDNITLIELLEEVTDDYKS